MTTKPGGIRILNSVVKPAAAATQANGVTSPKQNGTPKTPLAPAPDELWAKFIAEADGEVAAAAIALKDKIAGGDSVAATAITSMVEYLGVSSLQTYGFIETLESALSSDSTPVGVCQAALKACACLAKHCGKPCEPFLVPLLPNILTKYADKTLKKSAKETGTAIIQNLNAHASRTVVTMLLEQLRSPKWQARVGALNLLAELAKRCPSEVGHCMIDVTPVLSNTMVDGRPEIAEAGSAAMLACCATSGNRDLEAHIPALVSCIAKPDEVSDVIAKLSATTFVQAMEDACLAVMVPLLMRALRERSAKTQRRASIIIENIGKLVQHPADARPFLPLLLPGLDKVSAEAADPELREVAGRAKEGLEKLKAADEELTKEVGVAADAPALSVYLAETITAEAPEAQVGGEPLVRVIPHVAALCASLIASHVRGIKSWEGCLVPYLAPHIGDEHAATVFKAVRRWALHHMGEVVEDDEDDDEAELCNCEFSLAYGGRILLTNTTLRMRRGHLYGLCGANGAGKSTLMKAIANGQLEGFPPKEELRTIMVAHDIDASQSDTSVVDFILADAMVREVVNPDRQQVEETLSSVGFTRELLDSSIVSLSGGWRMKLALAKSMLLKADILLLDEPTNHLDTTNVRWLEEYLNTSTDISALVVSHDSGFLETVCTDIIHYENRKLVLYPGRLSEFVEKKPEAKSYYQLESSTLKFKFPEPGFLDGIKSKSNSIMRMQKVSFSWPGSTKRQLNDVTVRCTLGSRIACLGRNGAGKSTLIKLLTGETEPDEGTVWRHPNMRLAYVAQHAFHHVEEHLDKTPSEYLWWRFADGEDREAKEKITRKLTPEEQAARDAAIARGERVVDYLNSRRMGKTKEYEYEVAWVGQSYRENKWITRTELCQKMGLSKLVEDMDARIAVFRLYRPLSTAVVLQHLQDFGIEEEIAAHNRIRGLSGGQKVKLVLAAAMWCQPHVLVLDEPTNYLDREALGALATAIKEFNGGVIMISHNSEFTSALCTEEWNVADGKVTVAGGSRLSHVPSTVSMVSVSSVASISTLGGADSDSTVGMDEEGMDEEALAARLEEKVKYKADKARIAAEKAAKKAEKAKLRFAKKF